MLYCDSRCSQTLPGLSPALLGALLCNATCRLGDGQRVIFRQRVRGSVRAVRAVRNTRVFQTETRVVADVIQKPTRSLQIHSERELLKRFRERGSGNCNRRQCLHLDQWSPAVAASIDLVTQTWRVLCLQRADSWSSTCGTDGRLWVQATWRQ